MRGKLPSVHCRYQARTRGDHKGLVASAGPNLKANETRSDKARRLLLPVSCHERPQISLRNIPRHVRHTAGSPNKNPPPPPPPPPPVSETDLLFLKSTYFTTDKFRSESQTFLILWYAFSFLDKNGIHCKVCTISFERPVKYLCDGWHIFPPKYEAWTHYNRP